MPDTDSAQPFFSQTFAEAREKFRAAAKRAGAVVESYPHPREALSGGPLSCDVARIGDPRAETVLVTVTGTHGVEAYAGAALQVSDLSRIATEGPPAVAALHIHGINPWGMDRLHRATENNVDLNRNFVDHSSGLPDNAAYRELHDIVCPSAWDEKSQEQIMDQLDEYAVEHSPARLVNGLISGQYSHPGGLNFGGVQPEWSNVVLRRICHEQLAHAKRILFIDWHTGLGGFGEGVFLCFNEPASDEFALACEWFGPNNITAEHFAESGTPRYKGLLCLGARDFLPAARVLTLVVEFGTRGRDRVRPALMLDRWLQVEARASGQALDAWQYFVRDVFDPQDESWRSAVELAGLKILAQGYRGLARWSA